MQGKMFEPKHWVNLQENAGFGTWLSGDNSNSSPTHHRTESSLARSVPSNVDSELYKDLVEMIPLVQSLIERKPNSSFTRRGSIIYTKTPSRESLSRKVSYVKGRNGALSIPVKRKKDQVDKNDSNNGDSLSIFSSKDLISEKESDELIVLREQVEDLQKRLLEKEELLKSAEISGNRINDVQAELDQLNRHAAEKDSLIKSFQLQLYDAKIKLADKQAALEKTQWEAMTSKQKLEKLQNDIDSMQGEFSLFMQLFNGLANNNLTSCDEDYDVAPYHLEHLSCVGDKETPEMEEASQAYIAALDAAKEKQDEESVAAAASARLHLQSILFKSQDA